jgi:hypothetical protein
LTGSGIRLYDPSSDFMIIRDYFPLPTHTKRWKLRFENQSTSSYFFFMSTDSVQSDPGDASRFPVRWFWEKGSFDTPWVTKISNSQANYVITGSSFDGGFLDFDYIVLTYEAIK